MDTSENQRAHRGGKTLHKPDVLESVATVGNRGWRFAAKRRVFVHLVPIELLLEQLSEGGLLHHIIDFAEGGHFRQIVAVRVKHGLNILLVEHQEITLKLLARPREME